MAKRTQRSVKCDFGVKQDGELWKCRSYAYLAKRMNKLYVNIAIEDENSVNKSTGKPNFILSRCIVNQDDILIEYSEFNNDVPVKMSKGQENLTRLFAREIYKEYFK